MNMTRLTLISLLIGLCVFSAPSQAADIDIYSGINTTGTPNVLFVMDNGANFDSATSATPCLIPPTVGGTAVTNLMAKNTTTNSAGGIEQCALYSAVSQLPINADGSAVVSIGFMLYNGPNVHDYTGANCGGSLGGCLAFPLTPMTAALKITMLNWIASWTSGTVKASGQATAASMQEAWAYYAGQIGLSTRKYPGIPAGCQKNFVLYLGNAYGSSSHPGDSNSGGPAAALTAAYSPATPPTNTSSGMILGTITTSCGPFSFPSNSTHQSGGFYGDEWAQFMHNTDVNSVSSGIQNIITYTIGLLGPSCPADYPALLISMANYGGGKYFAATDQGTITQALLKILNEVQAVNSVFSSASLPVSVNTQGTYLNQIYMGMFRPDPSGNPRWVGNLKQYQFSLNFTTSPPSLYLADATGTGAISSSTGFITNGAMSFWSCTSSSRAGTLGNSLSLTTAIINKITCPTPSTTSGGTDPTAGFFASTSSYLSDTTITGGAYDLQDGQVVEKGGAGQLIRLANLIASYPPAYAGSGTGTGTDSPRNLYVYCPSGTGCVSNLTDPTNNFSVNNGGLTAALFGTGSMVPVKSIVRCTLTTLPGCTGLTGSTAVVTTSGAHGFTTGNSVSIEGATPGEYVVTQNITVTGTQTFTITGLGDYPNTPSTGTYAAAVHSLSPPQTISSVSLATSTTQNSLGCSAPAANIPNISCNQVTVTLPGHGYVNGNTVFIQGVSPSAYSGAFVIGNVTLTTFTYNVPVTPTSPSVNAYSATLSSSSISITNIAYANGSNKTVVTAPNSYTAGQSVLISGSSVSANNGVYTVASPTASGFKITGGANCASGCGSVTLVNPVISIAAGNISRASVTATTATATGITASAFSTGQMVKIAYVSGTGTNELAYAPPTGANTVTITCTGTCTSFTFPITTVPSNTTLTTSSPTAALSTPVSIPAGAITRSNISPLGTTSTVTVTGVANAFTSGDYIDISVSGTAVGTESDYLSPAAGWLITCPVLCSTAFTFGPVTLTPTPASGTIYASQSSDSPDRTSLINWIRGQDNVGDELSLCPGAVASTSSNAIAGANYANCPPTPVTVRPSVHGDVLHSRPIAVNYGGSTGVVVYYGSNDGIYHAVNGNQTAAIGSTPPGGELWGFLKTDLLGKYVRQRTNAPALLLSTTPSGILPAPVPKDYFIDGPTGLYQTIDGNGNTTHAYIYLGLRRGGRMINALDVTDPAIPLYKWKLTNASNGTGGWDLNEMGQTWSLPKIANVRGYANPVMIFGAGYDDGNEDNEPPTADSMGRGIYIFDAITGALVWQVGPNAPTVTCTMTQCQKQETGMVYSIPSDITVMDKNGDGFMDRLYVGDVGGNVWRVDLEPAAGNTPDNWQVEKLAALGCNTGTCAANTTPRKFFFPPEVVSTSNYDAVIIGSGDREHPLYSTCTNCAYTVVNRLYVLKDTATGNDGLGLTTITEQPLLALSSLDDCTGTGTIASMSGCSIATTGAASVTTYDLLSPGQQHSGYYITLTGTTAGTASPGEKVVNAPLVAAGYVYFGTNQPATPSMTSCTTNLGIARGYQLNPFSASYGSVVYTGGGLPPSPVAGIVNITNADGSVSQVPFVIGGATPGCQTADCTSAVAASRVQINVPTNRRRNYWYLKGK